MMVFRAESTDSTSSRMDSTSTVHISWKVATKCMVPPSVRTSARLPGPCQQTTTTPLWQLSLLNPLLTVAPMCPPGGPVPAQVLMLNISKLLDSLRRPPSAPTPSPMAHKNQLLKSHTRTSLPRIQFEVRNGLQHIVKRYAYFLDFSYKSIAY